MADTTFDVALKFLAGPYGQVALGISLGVGVSKLFKAIGDVLNDATNKEIADWIKDQHVRTWIIAEQANTWPVTFSRVFDQVFGEKHLSWRCFWRSCVASLGLYCLIFVLLAALVLPSLPSPRDNLKVILVGGLGNAIFDYASLLETRVVLGAIARSSSVFRWVLLLLLDFILTIMIAVGSLVLVAPLQLAISQLVTEGFATADPAFWEMLPEAYALRSEFDLSTWQNNVTPKIAVPTELTGLVGQKSEFVISPTIPFYMSALFTSVWIWLYAAAGFALKAARRFDIGFEWFNSKADIDKKPLQAIGIVAGAIIAVAYCAGALAFWLLFVA